MAYPAKFDRHGQEVTENKEMVKCAYLPCSRIMPLGAVFSGNGTSEHYCSEYCVQQTVKEGALKHDPVNHPKHYTQHPSGVECIQIARHFNFNLGNAIKYIWRSGLKSDKPIEDLEKAIWYLKDEIERRRTENFNGVY